MADLEVAELEFMRPERPRKREEQHQRETVVNADPLTGALRKRGRRRAWLRMRRSARKVLQWECPLFWPRLQGRGNSVREFKRIRREDAVSRQVRRGGARGLPGS